MRIGRILMDIGMIHNDPDMVKKITKDMIIVRAEQLFEHNAIEYVALGDMFDDIEDGKAPNYQIEVLDDGAVKFNRWIDG